MWPPSATGGNVLDATLEEVYLDGSSTPASPSPSVSNPAGNRSIIAITCPLNNTVSIPGDFNNFSDLFLVLNTCGVPAGGITVNVNAGTVFDERPPALTATGYADRPIVIQKKGTGANPEIRQPSSAVGDIDPINSGIGAGPPLNTRMVVGDALIELVGTDYLTWDGIDLYAFQTGTTRERMEYGLHLMRTDGTDGCQHNTFRNFSITTTTARQETAGILASNTDPDLNLVTVTDPAGTNSYNTFDNLTISSYHGILLRGYDDPSEPFTYYDQANQIGGSGTVDIKPPSNLTGYDLDWYGIYADYQNELTISDADITGNFQCETTDSPRSYGIATYADPSSSIINGGSSLTIENNTIGVQTGQNGLGWFYAIYNKAGKADNVSIKNNTISGNNNSLHPSGSNNPMYMIYTSVGAHKLDISGNTISGNYSRGRYTPYFYVIDQGSNLDSLLIHGNTITNNHIYDYNSPTDNSLLYGLRNSSEGITQIYDNTFGNLSSAGRATVINSFGATEQSIFNNEIYDITANAAAYSSIHDYHTVLSGIFSEYNKKLDVYNNYVSDLKAPNSNNPDAIRGISLCRNSWPTTLLKVYHNTVYLNASSSGSGFGSTALYLYTDATADVRNNILVNTSTPSGGGKTVVLRRNGTDYSTYLDSSNNNAFYVGPEPLAANRFCYSDGSTDYASLCDYQSYSGIKDASSVYTMPTFRNTGSNPPDLRLDPATATPLESGGGPIATITEDHEGDSRSTTFPDIGADEGSYTLQDVAGPVINYIPFGNGTSTTSRLVVNIEITDPSGVNTSTHKPRLYYKRLSDLHSINDNTSGTKGWKYVEANNSSSPFEFTIDYSRIFGGSVSVGDQIQYFVVAQDLAGTPNVSLNPGSVCPAPADVDLVSAELPAATEALTYQIVAPFPPVVNVPGDYASLTRNGGVFEAINNGALSGDLTIQITADISIEDGTHALEAWDEEGTGNYTVTIQPDADASRTISGSYAGGLIRFENAKNVVVNGAFSGTTRRLTFANTHSAGSDPSPSVFQIISTGTVSEYQSDEIRIQNTIIEAQKIATDASVGSHGIYVGGPDISLGQYAGQAGRIYLQNNRIRSASNGIIVQAEEVYPGEYIEISDNHIGGSASADYIVYEGIYAKHFNAGSISGNHVEGVQNSAKYGHVRGIEAGVKNCIIEGNEVHNLFLDGVGHYEQSALEVSSYGDGSLIRNNIVYDIRNDMDVTTDARMMPTGIMVRSASNVNVYNNSVYLYGVNANGGIAFNSAAFSVPFRVVGLDVRNNIFMNDMGASAPSGSYCYALYIRETAEFAKIDYNNYFGTGDFYVGRQGSDIISLDDWKAHSGQDSSSISGDPAYTSTSNLMPDPSQPNAWHNNGTGVQLASVAQDFNGVGRSTTLANGAPDLGAYEFTPSSLPPIATVTGTHSPGGLEEIYVAERKIATIYWRPGSAMPSLGDVRYYSGDWPNDDGASTLASAEYFNCYLHLPGDETAGVDYDVTLHYDPALQGTVSNPQDIAYTQRDASGGLWTAYFTDQRHRHMKSKNLDVHNAYSRITGTNLSQPTPSPLVGDYYVGNCLGTEDFLTIGDALAFIKNFGVAGDVQLNLSCPEYSEATGENFPLRFTAFDPTHTLTMKPDLGNTSCTIKASTGAGEAVIEILGGRGLVLDGSHNGTHSHNLHIQQERLSGAAALWVQVPSASPSADVHIQHVDLTTYSAYEVNNIGLLVGGASYMSPSQDQISNLRIEDNSFTKSYYGLYINAQNPDATTDLQIRNNQIGASGLEGAIGYQGASIENVRKEALIEDNTFQNITSSFGGVRAGLSLVGHTDALVSSNQFQDILNTNTSGGGAHGIHVQTSNSSGVSPQIENNRFAFIQGTGTTGLLGMSTGILASGSYDSLLVYNNSFNLFGNMSTDMATKAAALAGQDLDARPTEVYNNLIQNSMSNTVNTSHRSYALYSENAVGSTASFGYNNYYASGAQAEVGYNGSTNLNTLADWKAYFTEDTSSIYAPVAFSSTYNLLPDVNDPSAWYANGTGNQIPGLDEDGQNNLRSTTRANGAPDMGAYEFTPLATPPLSTATGAIADGNTISFKVGQRTIASITWHGSSLPSSVEMRYYSGEDPVGLAANHFNAYLDIEATGGSGYTYDIHYFYDQALWGNANFNSVYVAKKSGANPWESFSTTRTSSLNASGLTAFSQFTGSELVPIGLDVQLLNFHAQAEEDYNSLQWATVPDKELRAFQIEKGPSVEEMQLWKSLPVEPRGAVQLLEKEVRDSEIRAGTIYYRLIGTDASGKHLFTSLQSVYRGKDVRIQVYPNPFVEHLNVNVEGGHSNSYQLQVRDALGRLVHEQQLGQGSQVLSTREWASGLYIIELLENGLSVQTIKRIKP